MTGSKNIRIFSRRHMVLTIIAMAFISIGYFLWNLSSPLDTRLLKPDNAEIITLGGKLYATECASCHGANLEGESNWQRPNSDLTMPAPPHDKFGHTWHHNDELLFKLTKYGLGNVMNKPNYKTNMPAFDDKLSDAEIIAILSYIKSNWPEDIRKHHDKLNQQGEKTR